MDVVDNNSYYIASATQFMDPTACAGKVKGDTIDYVIQQPYGTYLGKAAEVLCALGLASRLI